jgi:CPA2 family monovalent cation:H+ antiporter-2
MTVLAAASDEVALVFVELGAVFIGLAFLARLAHRLGISPIPLYLVAGLAFGTGGLLPLDVSAEFAAFGAEIGVVLLLFMLGLEYTAGELKTSLRTGAPAGLLDLVLNFTPGWLLGVILGWDTAASVLLGGVTYISSSGVIAKLLSDLDRLGNRETPAILTVLVIEDLVMAVYLPLVAVLLLGGEGGLTSVVVALATVAVVLLAALRFGGVISRVVSTRSAEALLLMVFGLVLLVAGTAQRLQVSSAIGAFLVGIALSGEVAERARGLLSPLRDLFAATFFVFFALQVDPRSIPAVAGLAAALAVVTALTKMATGWWAAGRIGVQERGRARAAATLVARGEFSIVIAGLAVAAGGVEPQLGPLAAAYVLMLASIGPLLARYADYVGNPLAERAARRREQPTRVERASSGN